jgi:hypothetical protein
MKEQWKFIKDFNNKYQISNYGRIKSLKGLKERILKTYKNYNGYVKVGLHKNGKSVKFRVHRLVALYFLENPLNKRTVNHKDFNKENNNVNNLEFMTIQENLKHYYNIRRNI